jgi:hypothetical protein
MKVLDCETIDSAYESLEPILGTNRCRLESVFENLDLKQFYRHNPITLYLPRSSFLLRCVRRRPWQESMTGLAGFT